MDIPKFSTWSAEDMAKLRGEVDAARIYPRDMPADMKILFERCATWVHSTFRGCMLPRACWETPPKQFVGSERDD